MVIWHYCDYYCLSMATYEVLVSFILLAQLSTARCGVWNDIFHFDDDLHLLWNNKLTTQNKCFAKLQDSSIVEGVCKTTADCLLTKGIPRGGCGLLSTCCTYERSCGRSSNSKVSYFTSGLNPLHTDVPCSFNVIRANDRICQIRLDFIEFNLARPKLTRFSSTSEQYQCSDDNFYVSAVTGIPQICGYNTGQHMYIHLSPNRPNISLNVKLLARDTDPPHWIIKVTQLECPGKHYLLNGLDHEVAKDFEILAPPGCLQFFTKTTDYVRSFAYDMSQAGTITEQQTLASNQRYSICVKRPENTCGIEYIFKYFTLGEDPRCSELYMEMPGTGNAVLSKICGIHAPEAVFNASPPGPLHLDVHVNSNPTVGGFRIKYDIKSC